MMKIVEVDTNLVREYNLIIIFLWIRLFCEQILFISIFQRSRSCDTWAEFQNFSVFPLQLVCITRHIGAWADKTHVANKHIPKLR